MRQGTVNFNYKEELNKMTCENCKYDNRCTKTVLHYNYNVHANSCARSINYCSLWQEK